MTGCFKVYFFWSEGFHVRVCIPLWLGNDTYVGALLFVLGVRYPRTSGVDTLVMVLEAC
jgi:hypothetical protein